MQERPTPVAVQVVVWLVLPVVFVAGLAAMSYSASWPDRGIGAVCLLGGIGLGLSVPMNRARRGRRVSGSAACPRCLALAANRADVGHVPEVGDRASDRRLCDGRGVRCRRRRRFEGGSVPIIIAALAIIVGGLLAAATISYADRPRVLIPPTLRHGPDET